MVRPTNLIVQRCLFNLGASVVWEQFRRFAMRAYGVPSAGMSRRTSSSSHTAAGCPPVRISWRLRPAADRLPGETVTEKNGIVFVNGKRLIESHVKPARRDSRSRTWKIRNGTYFFIGPGVRHQS
jgi:hypothetical protein